MVKTFDNIGTSRDDLLVGIGPAISKEHYLVDKKTLKEFYRNSEHKNSTVNSIKNDNFFYINKLHNLREKDLHQLDLRRFAYTQLLDEHIPNSNIDISNSCTFELKNEFNSWRRSKTISRQWNFICS